MTTAMVGERQVNPNKATETAEKGGGKGERTRVRRRGSGRRSGAGGGRQSRREDNHDVKKELCESIAGELRIRGQKRQDAVVW